MFEFYVLEVLKANRKLPREANNVDTRDIALASTVWLATCKHGHESIQNREPV